MKKILLVFLGILAIYGMIKTPILIIPAVLFGLISFLIIRNYDKKAKKNPDGELTRKQKINKDFAVSILMVAGIILAIAIAVYGIGEISPTTSSKSSDGSWHVEAFWGTDGKRYYHTVPGK